MLKCPESRNPTGKQIFTWLIHHWERDTPIICLPRQQPALGKKKIKNLKKIQPTKTLFLPPSQHTTQTKNLTHSSIKIWDKVRLTFLGKDKRCHMKTERPKEKKYLIYKELPYICTLIFGACTSTMSFALINKF